MLRTALASWALCTLSLAPAQTDPLADRHALIESLYKAGDHRGVIRAIDQQLGAVVGTTWQDSLHQYLYKYGYAHRKLYDAAAGTTAAERILARVRARGHAAHELEALFDLSWIHYDAGALDQCARVDSMAVAVADGAPDISLGQRGRARQYLAFDHSVLGHHQRSFFWAQEALAQYAKADSIPPTQWAESYTASGTSCWHLGRIHEAEAWYLKSQAVLGEPDDIPERERLVSVFGNLGVLWQNAGDLQRAKRYYQQGLKHCDAILRTTEDPFAREQALVQRSRTYLNLATVFFQAGNPGPARDLLNMAWKDRSSVLEPDDPQLLAVKERMADLELDAGELAKARDLITPYVEATRRRFGRLSEEHVRASIKLGDILSQMGDAHAAASLLNQALQARTAASGTRTDPVLVQGLQRRAAHHLRNGQPAAAAVDLHTARGVLLGIYDSTHHQVAALDVQLAEACFMQGNYAAAQNIAERVIARLADRVISVHKNGLPSPTQNPALLSDAIQWKVRAARAQARGSFDSTWSNQLDLAIAALARHRHALHDAAAKLQLMAAQERLFDLALDITFQSRTTVGEEAMAERFLALCEAQRSTLLKERLNAFKGVRFAGVPDTVLAHEQELLAALEIDPDDPTSPAMAMMQEQAYAAFLQRLQHAYPAYFDLRYGEPTITLAQVRTRLLKQGRALVSFALVDSALYTVVVTMDTARVVRASSAGLAAEVNNLNKAIEVRSTSDYFARAYHLYQRLLAPVLTGLQADELLLVPDGPLHQLSFDALLIAPSDAASYVGHVLLQRHATAYLLSATTAVQFADLARNCRTATLALAPGFTPEVKQHYIAQVKDSTDLDQHFLAYVRQPFAMRTAQRLGSLLSARVHVGEEASEGRFRREASAYGILHLGTHAEMNATDPMYARLVFSKDGSGVDPDADGYLHAYEIYELDLRAQLAVLTACETGAGRSDGEGVRSIGYGFAYAGCPSLVMALWNIDEKVSAEIITCFYEYLADGLPKHEALRRAKLDHLAHAKDELALPYYWAGLVLVGDVGPVDLPVWPRYRWWVIAAGVLLLGGVAFAWWRTTRKRIEA